MKLLKIFLCGVLAFGFGIAHANVFVLNKTPGKLYGKAFYFPFYQPLGDEKIKEFTLVPNGIIDLKVHRLTRLEFSDTKGGKSKVVSIDGDQRVFKFCEGMKWKDCRGKKLSGNARVSRNNGINLEVGDVIRGIGTLALAVTSGKGGFIISEIAHHGRTIFRKGKPKKFFYDLRDKPMSDIYGGKRTYLKK